jgi:hypothetical protein
MAGSRKSAEEDWDFAHLGIDETQYLTHFFHHWTAKFIPQIPARIIEQHTREGDAVLDPFMGCGTTLVEAAVRRRPAFGTDINPLAVKIARAKTMPVDEAALECFLSELDRRKRAGSVEAPGVASAAASGGFDLFPGSGKWFRADIAAAIRWVLLSIGSFDDATRNFVEVGLSDLLKGMSNARMDRTIPQLPPEPEYVDKKHYNRVVNNLTRRINVYSRLHSQLRRMLDALREYRSRADGTTCEPMLADARQLGQHVPRVKLAVTSPPYWNAQNYQKLHWLSFQTFGLEEPGAGEIGRRSNDYLCDMRAVLGQLAQVLEGVFAIVIGESKHGTHDNVRDACIAAGMKPLDTIRRRISMHAFFMKGVKTEFIYLFRNAVR